MSLVDMLGSKRSTFGPKFGAAAAEREALALPVPTSARSATAITRVTHLAIGIPLAGLVGRIVRNPLGIGSTNAGEQAGDAGRTTRGRADPSRLRHRRVGGTGAGRRRG